MADHREHGRGLALVLVSTSGYAMLPILAKLAYAEGVKPSGLLAYRFAVATALFAVMSPRGAAPLTGRQRITLWGLGGVFLVNALAYFKALETMPASIAALVIYTYPAIVTLLSAIAGLEPLTVRGATAAAMAVLGCALTVGGPMSGRIGPGVALAFVAACFYASYLVLSSRLAKGVPSEAAARHVAQSCLAVYVPWAAVEGTLKLPASPVAWVSILAIAVFCTVIALRALLGGLARIGPARTAVVSSLEVPLTLALAVAFLGETLGPHQWAGAVLILAAVVLQNAGSMRALARGRSGEIP